MARRKRFSGLEATLKNMRHPTTGVFDKTKVQDTLAGNYLKVKSNEVQLTVNRTPESLPGDLVEKALIPFSGENDAEGKIVLVSQRAISAMGSLSISMTLLNLEDGLTTEKRDKQFTPAKATFFLPDATQVSTKVDSQITGAKYNPREGKSYTFPFGQKEGATGADRTYIGVAASIRNGKAPNVNVSFQPEYIRV